ncbi:MULTISPECIES: FAD-dependent monooxygenase [Bacillaceae]|uniref:FAD-dependent oxidoreductase n=1 Tax=Gottfriedia luciferensis TaxID=178774 RepID=A0ABX2ZMV0_9BACI|nr:MULTISPECIES: FAD-dependent monooxygenase [Bacillaceae]ODG91058.1 FAD-dependent oxidoreductase [Gottfriedia luciferensis]PGZ87913.1 FAD-dependent oxidoreductase [Bacillus sp. AFS029533]SFC81690.1 2-polyprenyl-6-methoxyphenol hydroxylase [Bacillus sp. UNCCL81]
MKQPMRVLISGASIAGPALAYWLHRYGFEVTVVERAPSLRPGGYAVDIRGAAISVLERMGILDDVRSLDTHMTGVYFVNDKGKIKGKISEASMGNQQGMDIEIMRENLSNILFDLTKDKVTYIWGDSITSIHESMSGVEVQYTNGKPDTFDLIIGADGIHSNVRTLKFGDEDQFKRTLGCYISIFEFENYLNLDHSQMLYTVPGKTVGMYSANDKKEAKGMLVFQSEPLKYDRYNTEEQKNLIKNAFEELNGWETPNLLQKLINASDFYFDEICQIHMPTWSDGRIALVGDAAYCPSPLSGQGTSLALVGAYVLAGELKAANGDYKRSFITYENVMKNFVEKNQKIGLLTAGGMIEKSNFKILLRNAMLRFPILMNGMFKMITRMIAKAANEIELKDY